MLSCAILTNTLLCAMLLQPCYYSSPFIPPPLVSSLCRFPNSCMSTRSQSDSRRSISFHSSEPRESFQPISADSKSFQHELGGGHVKEIYSFEWQIQPHVLSHTPGLWPPYSEPKALLPDNGRSDLLSRGEHWDDAGCV